MDLPRVPLNVPGPNTEPDAPGGQVVYRSLTGLVKLWG